MKRIFPGGLDAGEKTLAPPERRVRHQFSSDEIFPELRIWSRDEDGHDRLHALGQIGIGALYLGRVDSAFSLTGLQQELMAQVHATGLFIREDGTSGTLQELDLSV